MDKTRIISWRERALSQQLENSDDKANGGKINVLWSSSQGGCGPLKRLLRDVESDWFYLFFIFFGLQFLFSLNIRNVLSILDAEPTESHLPPPTQAQRPTFHNPTGPGDDLVHSPDNASPNLSPISTTSATSKGSSESAIALRTSASFPCVTPSTRPAKRLRSSLNIPSSKTSGSPVLSSKGKGKFGISSNVLLKVSRSLNEKAMTEYSGSQQRTSQRSQALTRSSTQQVPPPLSLTRQTSDQLGSYPKPLREVEVAPLPTQSAQASIPEKKYSSTARTSETTSRHSTTITDSPRKVRLKALLKTIDQAAPFPNQTTPTVSESRTVSENSDLDSGRPAAQEPVRLLSDPRRRRPLALGMRRPVLPQKVAGSVLKLAGSISNGNSSQSSIMSAVSAVSSSLTVASLVGDISNSNQVAHPLSQHNGATKVRPQRSHAGYRVVSPQSTPAFNTLLLPSDIEDDLQGADEEIQGIQSTPEIANAGLQKELKEDDFEGHISSDGYSSSSYGDIDVDLTALEDVCKVYDA
ncbi:hypothetical protein BU17DRAFT_89614 [Hysterangium stoloniferum]|nr:hypothetical protein BU17DRAFT_89614 [Hysterangium stoloniferum]